MSSFFGFVVTRPPLAGFNLFSNRSKPLNLIVSIITWLDMPFVHPLSANFLRINIYLTQKIDENMLWNIAINDAGAEYDPLTLLRTHTMFGRPDWKSIYRRIREAIEIGQYLPGRTAQLKTKVGVSSGSSSASCSIIFLIHHRHTFADPVCLLRPSRRRHCNTLATTSSLHSQRFGRCSIISSLANLTALSRNTFEATHGRYPSFP